MSVIYETAGELWRAMKTDYNAELERRYRDAEEACNGFLLNKRGRSGGITAWDLFTGPTARAYQYASHELIEHWSKVGRISLAQYEAEWIYTRNEGEAFITSMWGGDS